MIKHLMLVILIVSNALSCKVDNTRIINIHLIGDSHITRFPIHLLSNKYSVRKTGFSGRTSSELKLLFKSIKIIENDVLIFQIGYNDIVRDYPANCDTIYNNFLAILDEISNPENSIIFTSIVPPIQSNYNNNIGLIKEVNDKLATLPGLSTNISFINLEPYLSGKGGFLHDEYTNDQIHLNSLGYEEFSRAISHDL